MNDYRKKQQEELEEIRKRRQTELKVLARLRKIQKREMELVEYLRNLRTGMTLPGFTQVKIVKNKGLFDDFDDIEIT